MELQELAAYAVTFFERNRRNAVRDVNDDPSFWMLKDRHPTWLYDLVHKAHGTMPPDDFKYEMVVDTLEALAEGQDPDESNLEADIYNSDLLRWLASHLERSGYVDEAVVEFGHASERGSHGGGVIGDIAQGQWYEKDEVWRLVVDSLKERLEEIDDGVRETFSKKGKMEDPKSWHPE